MASPAELPEQLARRVTSLRTLALAVAGLLAAGAAAALYSQRYARADDFREHVESETRARGALETRTTSLEAVMGYLHDDIHSMREQEQENARALGARVVPSPAERSR